MMTAVVAMAVAILVAAVIQVVAATPAMAKLAGRQRMMAMLQISVAEVAVIPVIPVAEVAVIPVIPVAEVAVILVAEAMPLVVTRLVAVKIQAGG